MKKKKSDVEFERRGLRRFFYGSPVTVFDWLLFILLAGVLFLSFEMRDLFHTAGCSYGFLDGHFLDFYDYLEANGIAENGSVGLGAAYLPTVYLIFALWNLPMKIFGFVPQASAQLGFIPIMWAKLLPCLVFILSGVVVYKICQELKMSERKTKLCLFAYLGSPVCLFGQFALGQYESFMTFCLILGFYFWLRKKDILFIATFAVAMTFKYTAILFFLPLLLLREKRIWRILLETAGVFVLMALEMLVFWHSEAFRMNAFGIGASSGSPVGYVTNAAYFTGFNFGDHMQFVVYLAFVAFAFVVAYAYFKKLPDEREHASYGIYLMCLSAAALFCFSKWHPHWLMIAVPFWTISAFLHRDTKIFMAIDLLFGVLLIMFSVCQFHEVTDEVMLNKGIFKFLLPESGISKESRMSDMLGILNMSIELTLLTAIMGVHALFKHPKFFSESADLRQDDSIGWIRARMILPVVVLMLPALFVIRTTLHPSVSPYQEENCAIFIEIPEGESVSQRFTSAGDTLKKLKFPVSVGDNSTKTMAVLKISSDEGDVLYEADLRAESFYEGELVSLKPGIPLEEGKEYTVSFEIDTAERDSTFRLLAAPASEGFQNALIGGEEADCHLDMNIYQ